MDTEETFPEILCSVRICENLLVEAFLKSVSIRRSVYQHLLSESDKISLITEFTNLLAFIKSLSKSCHTDASEYVKIARAFLLTFLETTDRQDSCKGLLSFICE